MDSQRVRGKGRVFRVRLLVGCPGRVFNFVFQRRGSGSDFRVGCPGQGSGSSSGSAVRMGFKFRDPGRGSGSGCRVSCPGWGSNSVFRVGVPGRKECMFYKLSEKM